MKAKIKFKCLSNQGKIVTIVDSIDCLEFEEVHSSFKQEVNGVNHDLNFVDSVDSQVIDYLDSIDKSFIMNKHDIHTIIDYSVVPKKAKPNKNKAKQVNLTSAMILHPEELSLDTIKDRKQLEIVVIVNRIIEKSDPKNRQQMSDDFTAVYNKMRSSINGLDVVKQINIVFESMNVAYLSATNAYQYIMDYSSTVKGILEEKTESYKKDGLYYMPTIAPSKQEIYDRMDKNAKQISNL